MNDDEFSSIVRSGSQHSVSVSEHTGNAKTPKNIVVSHEEETEARKRAFEQKALQALEAQKALAAALDEHTENIAPAAPANANIQKLGADSPTQNRQAIAADAALGPNVQTVSTEVLAANIQNVGTEAIRPNVQSIGSDKALAANVQNVSVDGVAANHQKLASDNGIQDNRQGIPTDAINTNRQDVPTNVLASNVQDIPVGGFAANHQKLGQEALGQNRQGLDAAPATAPNLQTLPSDKGIDHRQTLAADAATHNSPTLAHEGQGVNTQGLAQLHAQDNHQAIPQDNVSPNTQSVATEPGMGRNRQALPSDPAILNRQAAPEAASPGLNRQAVQNEKIESHFEQIASEAVVRKEVDFSGAANPAKAGSGATKPTTARRAPVTEAQKREALRKREQLNDAFHGRLAGIKQNVDALNDRLTDLEEKVHKEDAKLDKGNPNDFRVELD